MISPGAAAPQASTAHLPIGREVRLADRYDVDEGPVALGGIHAIVRLVLDQLKEDRGAGRRVGGLVSGYPGSPLGGLDLEFGRQASRLAGLDLRFQPGVNEELAATAVWGSQLVPALTGARVEGVLGVWYGKSPGVDRAADALRHEKLRRRASARRNARAVRRRPAVQVLVDRRRIRGGAGGDWDPDPLSGDAARDTRARTSSESEIEKRLNKLGPYSNKVAPKASSMNAAAAVWNHPLPLRFVIPNQPSTHEISEVSSLKSPAGEADSSSDEWTGDEEFLPKNVRHQARMLEAQKAREREEQKRKKKEAPEPKPFMSPENLCKAAENSREVKKLLEASPLKKAFGLEFQPKAPGSPSRFTPMWIEPVRDGKSYS